MISFTSAIQLTRVGKSLSPYLPPLGLSTEVDEFLTVLKRYLQTSRKPGVGTGIAALGSASEPLICEIYTSTFSHDSLDYLFGFGRDLHSLLVYRCHEASIGRATGWSESCCINFLWADKVRDRYWLRNLFTISWELRALSRIGMGDVQP